MPKRKRKIFSRPRKLYDKARITEEDAIVLKYGLKNKREIWKADSAISRIRNLAKNLITKSEEEKKAFVERLRAKGFDVSSIPDVLSLNKENWLKRRLETVVFEKKLASTPKQARQLITHKHVLIGDRIVNIPSYLVSLKEEQEIELNLVLNIKRPEKNVVEKIKEEVLEGSE